MRKVTEGLNFVRERGEAMTVNVMSMKVQLRNAEKALVGVDYDPMCLQVLKNNP